MDVLERADLPFPKSLTEFQKIFPDEASCSAWLEQSRWRDGFQCPHCAEAGEPFRFIRRPTVFRCRKCGKNTSLTVGTVMERTHTPLSTWFWGAYLVATQTPGMSAVQFQRQLGLSRYETAFQILHKLRAGMVRPDADKIGSHPHAHIEVDETWIGGKTRGEGRGVHHKTLVAAAVEVRKPELGEFDGCGQQTRRNGRFAGRIRLAVIEDRSASTLCGFVEKVVLPKATIISDDWVGYATLRKRGYDHRPITLNGDHALADQALPFVHLVFSNLKTWLLGTHHGVSEQHLQAYLNEYAFRFNRRGHPFNAFRSLLGIAGSVGGPTYEDLYSGEWRHPTSCTTGC